MNRPTRRYAPAEKFEVGDRMEHPSFGQGIVELAAEPGKVTVFFPSGRRLLVHDRQAARPSLPKAAPVPVAKPDAE